MYKIFESSISLQKENRNTLPYYKININIQISLKSLFFDETLFYQSSHNTFRYEIFEKKLFGFKKFFIEISSV